MNSYLEVAEIVLKQTRKPMSAKAIIKHAYRNHIAPEHIYGKTQHKTLQARLSEDILKERENSLFFRTKPGYFFLRKFIKDPTIPIEFRQPIIARRRTRDIFREPALAINYLKYKASLNNNNTSDIKKLLLISDNYHYVNPKHINNNDILVWATSSLIKNDKILSYRLGRYRDDRDNFANKRSIAFSTLVKENDRTFFNQETLGISEAAFMSIAIDLDIPIPEAIASNSNFKNELKFIRLHSDSDHKRIFIAFVQIEAPEWFEPTTTKLSLNDLRWLDITVPPNNLNDYDPFSQIILSYFFKS